MTLELQKIIRDEEEGEEKGEDIDITDMKIYYDTETGQYKKKFICDDCSKDPICVCYDSLEEAFSGAMEGYWCNLCSIKNDMLDEPEILHNIIEQLEEQPELKRMDKLCDFIISMFTKEEIKDILRARNAACCDECSGNKITGGDMDA